jgi:hypothetical protein
MDNHMDWLLSLANNIQHKFYDRRIEQLLTTYLEKSSVPIIKNTIINNNYQFYIFADNPRDVFYDIIKQIQSDASEDEKLLFKPITIITKLADREFIFDINGDQMIYGISTKYYDESLTKSIACRYMYSIKNYFDLDGSFEILQFHNKIGGRKSNKKRKISPRVNIKINILSRLIQYVKSNSSLMGSLIYLNNLSDIDNHALDIIYSDNRSKSAVIDYIKLLVAAEYKDYSFEYNSHMGFSIPYDFRLKKFSCFVKHKKSGQTTYLVNLYNSATYDPTPCFRIIDKPDICQLMAHPLVRLRFLYVDLYLLKSKKSEIASQSFERIIHAMVDKAYNELLSEDRTPIWAGIYKDESYDRNQENMRSNVEVPYETILI